MKQFIGPAARRILLGAIALLLQANPVFAAGTKLKVAYLPIMPMSQLFVMEGEGWTKKAGLELELTKFSSGPAIVQAIASGGYDVMYFGIGPAMVSRANGVPIKVVASNVIEQISLVAQGEFAKTMKAAANPAAGIRDFTKRTGRKPKIASLPKGSVPDLVFRHWLIKIAGLKITDVDLVGMGTDKVQQAILAKSVDAVSMLEPVSTIVQERLKNSYTIAYGGQMFPRQPGAVVAVRESVIKEKRAAVAKLVELHVRATEMLNKDPKRAVKHVHKFLGQGLVPLQTFETAMTSPISNFVADPHSIVAATKTMHDFSKEIGTLKKPVPIDKLFDHSFYDSLGKK